MDKQTIFITAAIVVVILGVLWFGYRALKRYTCCGTCGCDLMTKKERKAYDARRASLGEKAEKPVVESKSRR